MGKSIVSTGSFSIAMLNYRRVSSAINFAEFKCCGTGERGSGQIARPLYCNVGHPRSSTDGSCFINCSSHSWRICLCILHYRSHFPGCEFQSASAMCETQVLGCAFKSVAGLYPCSESSSRGFFPYMHALCMYVNVHIYICLCICIDTNMY